MKTKQLAKYSLKFIIVFFLLFFTIQKGFCQKNTLKITPLKVMFEKTNISYERNLFGSWSAIADVQLWFLNKKETSKDDHPVLESINGPRISLELRGYGNIFEDELNSINLYFGFGGFRGRHNVNMIRRSFTYYNSNSPWPRRSAELSGAKTIISSGGYMNTGIQFALGEVLKIEMGILLGQSWINQENEFVTLFEDKYYVLEEDRLTLDQDYSKEIFGLYFEPMLNLGLSF